MFLISDCQKSTYKTNCNHQSYLSKPLQKKINHIYLLFDNSQIFYKIMFLISKEFTILFKLKFLTSINLSSPTKNKLGSKPKQIVSTQLWVKGRDEWKQYLSNFEFQIKVRIGNPIWSGVASDELRCNINNDYFPLLQCFNFERKWGWGWFSQYYDVRNINIDVHWETTTHLCGAHITIKSAF